MIDGWYSRVYEDGTIVSGASTVTLGTTPLGLGIAPQRFDESQLIIKAFDDRPYLVPLRPYSNADRVQMGSECTMIAAGGGRLVSAVVGSGVIWVAMSRQGTAAHVEEIGGSNFRRTLWWEFHAGPLVSEEPINFCRAEGDAIVWTYFGGPRGREIRGARMGSAVEALQLSRSAELSAVPIPTPDGMWVMVQTNDDLRLAPWGETHGYIISTGEDQNLHPDACWQVNGSGILVVANDGHGNRVGPWLIALDEVRVDLLAAEPTPALPDLTGRALWLGFFEGNTSEPAALGPGNCLVAGRRVTGRQERPFIIAGGTPTGRELGRWVQGSSVGEIEDNARMVSRPVAYWDSRAWPRLPVLPHDSWLCLQAYCRRDESPQAFRDAMKRELDKVRDRAVALVAQCYTSNALNTTDLASLVPVYADLVNAYPNVVAVLVFSGYGRATGYEDHPEVHELWKQFAAMITEPTVPNVPKITITSYEPKVGPLPLRVRAIYAMEQGSGPIERLEWQSRRPGGMWVTNAVNDPADPDHTYTFIDAGVWEIRLRAVGGGGIGQTGVLRQVRVTTTAGTDVLLPTYEEFLDQEGPDVDRTYGHPSSEDVAHTAWRRLNENWSHENVLRGIRNEEPISLDQSIRVQIPYEQWMNVELPQILLAYKQKNGRAAAPGDIRQSAWRRFIEGWTLDNILRALRGGTPAGPTPVDPGHVGWRPSQSEILTGLRANLAMSDVEGDESPWFVGDVFDWDDGLFAAFVSKYKSEGNKLLPIQLSMQNYRGHSFDYTNDTSEVRRRIERVYTAGLIPMLNLMMVDERRRGSETIEILKRVLPELKDHVQICFTAWELEVHQGDDSAYTPDEHASVIELADSILGNVLIGVEFASPADRPDPIVFDGRIAAEPPDYYRRDEAKRFDILMLEVPHDLLDGGSLLGKRRVAKEVGGAVYRLQGSFNKPTTWPEGDPIDDDTLANLRNDMGLRKHVILFEYGSWQKWSTDRKRAIREYVERVVPISGYGEG